MNETFLQLIIIAVSLAFCVFGFIGQGKEPFVTNDIQRFSIGHAKRRAFPIAAGISMTFVGGAATLNMASLGYQYGWSMLIDPICVGLALVLCIVVTSRIRAGNGITISGLLSGSSLSLQVLLGIASFAIYLMLTAAQFVAIGKLLGPYFPGIDTSIIICAFAVVVFSYIYFRGFEAVTNTDILMFVFVLFLFALPAITVLSGSFGTPYVGLRPAEPSPANLLIYLGMPLLFVPVSHDISIRAKAAVSSSAAKVGFAFGAFFYCLFVTVSIWIGVYLRESGVVLVTTETALPTFFKMNLGVVGAISVIAVLAAIVSTLDSFGFDAVISFANDVAKPLGVGSDRRVIALSSAVVIVGSLLISLTFPRILGLILAGMLLYISLFIPIAAGKLISVPDSVLVVTSAITIGFLVATKVSGLTLPLEPLAFIVFHSALIVIAKYAVNR